MHGMYCRSAITSISRRFNHVVVAYGDERTKMNLSKKTLLIGAAVFFGLFVFCAANNGNEMAEYMYLTISLLLLVLGIAVRSSG